MNKRINRKEIRIDPENNYIITRKRIGYVPRKEASQADYDRIGFMSGLEVHQQLLTDNKLFCHCPAGVFNTNDEYDAKIVRHMRPTLSELGEYDGTALMEFRTRKEITYHINNKNSCTYDIDDTPPFIINKQALDIALELTILSKFNVVGEVHITRKQYLDGSIPAGFQRTAILGVEGEIQLRNKKIRLIQLSIEEDSCREISDVGHKRVYKTDRLGMPLVETVTYPEMMNPDEVKEACDYIRFLNRSTGKVRTGMGASREDVNVSCKGGTRVEIKGVAHTKWIPELTHVESFRQWSLLDIRKDLLFRVLDTDAWKVDSVDLDFDAFKITKDYIGEARDRGDRLIAVNLPKFRAILSHFTQPGKVFADEISDRLKVIACLEKPNMIHTEMTEQVLTNVDMDIIKIILNTNESEDAVIVFWAPQEDVKTAVETIEERCKMAFEGVPPETRKGFKDGTTIFERVLPGADRMYPDTDSMPIPLENKRIEELRKLIPNDISERMEQLSQWHFPISSFNYVFSKNLYQIIEKTIKELKVDSKVVAKIFGNNLKRIEGKYKKSPDFNYEKVYELIRFIKDSDLNINILDLMLIELFKNPDVEFESILKNINYTKLSKDDILSGFDKLSAEFDKIAINNNSKTKSSWIMGRLRPLALGNLELEDLKNTIDKFIQ